MTSSSLNLRRELLRLVTAFPGLHLRELARQAGLSESLAAYHLDALQAEGAVKARTEGNFRRFYPLGAPAPNEADRELMGVLRQAVPLQIAVVLLETPGVTHAVLTEALGLAKSTVSYHLVKLQEADVVVRAAHGPGFTLREPRRVERLLLRWEPPKGLVGRFAELWTTFYTARRK